MGKIANVCPRPFYRCVVLSNQRVYLLNQWSNLRRRCHSHAGALAGPHL
jgi:hypothetical protein